MLRGHAKAQGKRSRSVQHNLQEECCEHIEFRIWQSPERSANGSVRFRCSPQAPKPRLLPSGVGEFHRLYAERSSSVPPIVQTFMVDRFRHRLPRVLSGSSPLAFRIFNHLTRLVSLLATSSLQQSSPIQPDRFIDAPAISRDCFCDSELI
jgi:hypothetical protein